MNVPPVVFALVVAAATAWRCSRIGWPGRFAGGALAGALALYGAGVVHPPELGELIGSGGSTLGPDTYVLVAVMAFLETGAFVGLLVPGETVVIAASVVAGQGHVDVFVLLGLTWICALGGTSAGTSSVAALDVDSYSTTVPVCTSTRPGSSAWRSSSPATGWRRS